MKEKWSEERKKARAKVQEKVIQKTAEKAADNATLAADIKRKGLLILDRLFEDYMLVTATERTIYGENGKDVKRLRDLTAAFKDLTGDVQNNNSEANELLRSLYELERRSGHGD